MMKRKAEETVESVRNTAMQSLEHWKSLKKYGGHDPFWSDGENMNLVRNHIIFANGKIAQLANVPVQMDMFGVESPMKSNLYVEVPQEADKNYMARRKDIIKGAELALELIRASDYQRRDNDIRGLESAIERNDVISMRRYCYQQHVKGWE